jgi:hypothetical protein
LKDMVVVAAFGIAAARCRRRPHRERQRVHSRAVRATNPRAGASAASLTDSLQPYRSFPGLLRLFVSPRREMRLSAFVPNVRELEWIRSVDDG